MSIDEVSVNFLVSVFSWEVHCSPLLYMFVCSQCEKGVYVLLSDNLTMKDLKALLTALHETTTKWELLGIALGFDPEDLKIIEQTATLIPQGPVAYFKEMLYQWLKWGPPSHKTPTISYLCEALRNPTVGNQRLADSLRDKLKALRGITIT